MIDEGRVEVRLSVGGGVVRDAKVAVMRPQPIAALVKNRPWGSVPRLVGRVFSICATAQACAAARAVESARGLAEDPGTRAVRDALIVLEALDQNALRLALDWPSACGLDPDLAPLRRLRHEAARVARTVGAGGIWQVPGGQASAPDRTALHRSTDDLERVLEELVSGAGIEMPSEADGFAAWVEQGATPVSRSLDRVIADGWQSLGSGDEWAGLETAGLAAVAARMEEDADAFCRRPDLDGRPAETGPVAGWAGHPLVASLVARYGRGLLARMAARLVAAMEVPRQLRAIASGSEVAVEDLPEGLGIAATARGLLIHRARVDGEVVADYASVAPTEWNFHPDGVLARGLRGLAYGDPEDLTRKAGLLVSAVDPCVGHELRIEEARR